MRKQTFYIGNASMHRGIGVTIQVYTDRKEEIELQVARAFK
jgi:hypothetical protein